MFVSALAEIHAAVDEVARAFDGWALSGSESVRVVEELGAIRRQVDGMLGKAAKRMEDTAAHSRHGERDAASFAARKIGVPPGEVKRAISTAKQLEDLPSVDAAVRDGKLSARQ